MSDASSEMPREKRLPQIRLKLGRTVDGREIFLFRDRIGNVELKLWKQGQGFSETDRVSYTLHDLKRIAKWMMKVVEYVER